MKENLLTQTIKPLPVLLDEGRDETKAKAFKTQYWVNERVEGRLKLVSKSGPDVIGYAKTGIAKSAVAESQLAHALLILQSVNSVEPSTGDQFKCPIEGRNKRLEIVL